MTLASIFLEDLYSHMFSQYRLNLIGEDIKKKTSNLMASDVLPWFDNELNQRLEGLSVHERKKFLIHLSANLDAPAPLLRMPFGEVYKTCWESFMKHSSKFKAIAELALEEIESNKDLPAKHPITKADKGFDELGDEKTRGYILDLLEFLKVTKANDYILGPRKKGAILGVVLALKENSIIPGWSKDMLCKIIGDRISLKIGSKLGESFISVSYYKKAIRYIDNHKRP